MANINFFYPAKAKGTALGLNAAGGNLGVARHPVLPADHRRRRRHLRPGQGERGRASTSSAPATCTPAWRVVAAVCAYLFMNNLTVAKSKPREQLRGR